MSSISYFMCNFILILFLKKIFFKLLAYIYKCTVMLINFFTSQKLNIVFCVNLSKFSINGMFFALKAH